MLVDEQIWYKMVLKRMQIKFAENSYDDCISVQNGI